MSAWRFVETAPASAALNMGVDEALLQAAKEVGVPVLRFYEWSESAATFGYFQHYDEIAAWTTLRPLVRRTTGGGLVPHDADWTYSVIIPPGDAWYELRAAESYRRLHEWVAGALQIAGVAAELAAERMKDAPGQCFIGAEQFDVILKGRKIAGAAQRRTRDGLLIQGSVQPGELQSRKKEWQRAMVETISAEAWELPEAVETRAEELARIKYGAASYNQRR
jgi:lipoyl(octanoyl) transferase